MTAPLTDWPDILRFTLGIVGSTLPDVWVADRPPEPHEFADQLPCVVIDLLPGEETVPWGGHGKVIFDHMNFDIDVFAASRADAVPIANKVREVIHSLITVGDSPVVSVDCPGFTTRPDYNPHIRRLGVTASLSVRV